MADASSELAPPPSQDEARTHKTGQAGDGGGSWSLGPPPEGVNWANRWYELENAFVAVEAERNALKTEVVQLRNLRVEKAMEALSPAKVPVVDSQEMEKLKESHSAAQKKAETLLSQICDERTRSGKISEELQSKTESLASLSKDKLQLQYDLNIAKSNLLPVEEERDRLKNTLQVAQTQLEEVRVELTTVSEAKNRLFKEKQEIKQELSSQCEASELELKFQREVAEKAREAQEELRKKVHELEQKFQDQAAAFAEERANLDKKLELRDERLKREQELRESGVEQLKETKRSLEAAVESERKATASAQQQEELATDLEKKFNQLQREHEDLLRHRIPGADALTAPPEGYASISELVHQATTARADALKAKQEKEQYQDVLMEVEREVRARYPALERQRVENERLRLVATQLTKQNEGLLKEVQQLERGQRESQVQAKQAQRSAQILEEHARDMANQLGVLLVKNQRLNNKAPTKPVGVSDLQALETDNQYFRTVQDLVSQNEHLKKSVRRLTEECETAAQRELTIERQEHEEEKGAWEKHLAEKAEQMKALAENIERLTHERDEARRALREHPQPVTVDAASTAAANLSAGTVTSGTSGAGKERRGDLDLREQLAAVREAYTKTTEVLNDNIKRQRESENRLSQELAKKQQELDGFKSKNQVLETSLSKKDEQFEASKKERDRLEKRTSSLEQSFLKEEESAKNHEAAARQNRRDKDQLENNLKLERAKNGELEHRISTLLAEKATHAQTNAELQMRMTAQIDDYKTMNQNLEVAYKNAEKLMKEQLEHAKQREEDLQQSVKDLTSARIERENEAKEALKRAADLDTTVMRLETQLAERTYEIDELRAAGAARPRRGSEVAAEAEAQLQQSQAGRQKGVDVVRLEKELGWAKEREKQHEKDSALWKSLIDSHEKDLKERQGRVVELEGELAGLREQQAKHDELVEMSRKKEQELEATNFELGKQTSDLRAQVEKKEAEVVAARLEGEQKAHKVRIEAESVTRETADAHKNLEDWQRKHREAAEDFVAASRELDATKEKLKSLEAEAKELRQQNGDLAEDCKQARAQRTDELENWRKRAEEAQAHAAALGAETKKYQERLLAFAEQTAGGPEMERIASEMRRAREIGELQRQELELDKARAEREVKALRVEVGELQKRLDKEQEAALQLNAEVKRHQRAVSKLDQLGRLEDENRRLIEEVKSLQDRLDDTAKDLEGQKQQLEPLQITRRDMTRKEEEWERAKKTLEAKADEWKGLYDEMVQKFDAPDLKELQRLREDSKKWQEGKAELTKKMEKITEDLKKRTEEASQSQVLKKQNDELTKKASEALTQAQDLKAAKTQLEERSQKALSEGQRERDLKLLREKRIAGLEVEMAKLKEEAAKGNSAALKKAEDDLGLCRQQADRAISLAMDYKRGCEALIVKNNAMDSKNMALEAAARVREAASQLETPAIATSVGVANVTTSPAPVTTASVGGGVQSTVATVRSSTAEVIPKDIESTTSAPSGTNDTSLVGAPSGSTRAGVASNPFSVGGSTAALLFPSPSLQIPKSGGDLFGTSASTRPPVPTTEVPKSSVSANIQSTAGTSGVGMQTSTAGTSGVASIATGAKRKLESGSMSPVGTTVASTTEGPAKSMRVGSSASNMGIDPKASVSGQTTTPTPVAKKSPASHSAKKAGSPAVGVSSTTSSMGSTEGNVTMGSTSQVTAVSASSGFPVSIGTTAPNLAGSGSGLESEISTSGVVLIDEGSRQIDPTNAVPK